MKRTLSLLVALALVFTMIPAVFATDIKDSIEMDELVPGMQLNPEPAEIGQEYTTTWDEHYYIITPAEAGKLQFTVENGTIAVQGTADENGYYAVEAGVEYTVVVTKTGDVAPIWSAAVHTHSETYTDNGDGTHDGVCACGEVVADNEAHSYTDGTCVCGAEEKIACETHLAGTAVKENEVASTTTTTGSYDLAIYCSVCGEEMYRETIQTAMLDEDLILYETQLNLQAGIFGCFTSKTAKATRNKYAQIYLEVVRFAETTEGKQIITTQVTKEVTSTYTVFDYPVAAKEMTDVYSVAVVGVTADGAVYSSAPVTTSMKQVVMDKMAGYHNAGNTATAKMSVQMLKYAEEAQKTFTYNLGDLAMTGMEDFYRDTYLMTTEPELTQTHTIPAEQNSIKVSSHDLDLQSVIQSTIVYRMPKGYVASEYYAIVTHIDEKVGEETQEKTYRIEFSDCDTMGTTRYIYLAFSSLQACDMREGVTVTIYRNDEVVMDPYTYTVESVAASKKAGFPALVNAMMNYADCAKAVFG